MVITSKTRKTLLPLLPRNYRKLVSTRVGCHVNTVYNVLHREMDNHEVIEAILALAKEKKTKEKKLANKVQAITKQSSKG